MKPMDIEKESFAIIEKELTTDIPAEYKPVVKRVIHTTADFSYETSMTFSKGVIEEALKAIKEGVDIVTDTNMAKSGISHKMAEKFSCSLNCYMADSDVASEAAKRSEQGRSECGVRHRLSEPCGTRKTRIRYCDDYRQRSAGVGRTDGRLLLREQQVQRRSAYGLRRFRIEAPGHDQSEITRHFTYCQIRPQP